MARSRRPPEGPSLFDLPLNASDADSPELEEPPREAPAGARKEDPSPEGEAPSLFSDPPAPAPPRSATAPPAAEAPSPAAPEASESAPRRPPSGDDAGAEPVPRSPGPVPAPLSDRLRAGIADLAVHAAVALTVLVGTELLGARPGWSDLPPVLAFLVIFSFVYSVIPLAFWGQTPGMIWARLICRAADGQALTFGETVRRWLAGLVTIGLLGLPALLVLGDGRSFSDRLSSSRTWSLP